jgi:uncharacterized protein YmfQ (DUF2313 family)
MDHKVTIDVFPVRTVVWTVILLIIDYFLRWAAAMGRSFEIAQIENARKTYTQMYFAKQEVSIEEIKWLDVIVLSNVNGMFYDLARGMNDFTFTS